MKKNGLLTNMQHFHKTSIYLAVLYLLKYIKDNLLMCKSNAKAGDDDAQSLNTNDSMIKCPR